MTGTGWLPYDLAGNFCEECGRAKSLRLLGYLTGCSACDNVVTRHRCLKRPELDVGQSWTCPDCGTIWTVAEEEETCGECGQGIGIMGRTWETVPGDRIDTAPRYEPPPLWTPLRNLIPRSAMTPVRYESRSFGTCHRTDSGFMVHVKPGCRCKR